MEEMHEWDFYPHWPNDGQKDCKGTLGRLSIKTAKIMSKEAAKSTGTEPQTHPRNGSSQFNCAMAILNIRDRHHRFSQVLQWPPVYLGSSGFFHQMSWGSNTSDDNKNQNEKWCQSIIHCSRGRVLIIQQSMPIMSFLSRPISWRDFVLHAQWNPQRHQEQDSWYATSTLSSSSS